MTRTRWSLKRRAGATSAAAVLCAVAVVGGVELAGADPTSPRLGVRSQGLYVTADGNDSHTDGGVDFSGTVSAVNAGDGNLVIHEIDDPIADANGSFANSVFSVDRWYNSYSTVRRDVGRGWTTGLGYDVRLEGTSTNTLTLYIPSQHVVHFAVDSSNGPFTGTDDANYQLTRTSSGFTAENQSSGRDYNFDSNGALQSIDAADDGSSERFDYTSAGGQSRLSAVYGPDTKATRFSFNGDGQIIEADNPASQHGYYGYTGQLLTRATHPDGKISDYTYNGDQKLTGITRPGYQLSVSYDSQGRVSSFTETTGSATPVTATLTYRAPQPGTCNPARDASQTDVTSTSGSNKSYCFDQNGDLTSGAASADLPEQVIPLGNNAWTLGDIDGNGPADLALVDKTTGAVTARLNDGTGKVGDPAAWGTFGHGVKDIASADVDGFSSVDPNAAFYTSDIVTRDTANALDLRLSTGDGTIAKDTQTGPRQSTWPADRTLGLADVNGDGSADLWSVDSGDLRVSLANADGFDPTTTWGTVPSGVKVVLADMDDSGTADLVTYNPATGAVRVGLSDDGASSFDALSTWGTGPTGADVAAGSLSGSGPDDLYFRTGDGTVTGRRTGTTSISSTPIALGVLPTDYTLGAIDVTGDGPASVVGTKVDSGNLYLREINVAAIPGANP